MLTTIQGDINQCVCDICGYSWKSLVKPATCPRCLSRLWNGSKPRGRPRNPMQPDLRPPAKPKRNTRRNRKELPEYSTEW